MPRLTLLVLAAGMGSRYGGLKQIDPVGPNGETIIDYSIYDAIRAGFGKVVFVIRKDIEEYGLLKITEKGQKFLKKPVSTWGDRKFHTLELVTDDVLKFRWKGGGTEIFTRVSK